MNIKILVHIGFLYFFKPKYTVYFHSFGVQHIPKEINKFIDNKKIKASIFRIQAYNSIMCGYFCIKFINYMLKGKTLLDYTNLFSSRLLISCSRLLRIKGRMLPTRLRQTLQQL